MKQLIEALIYIHWTKLLHRDIKPCNILLFGNEEDRNNPFKINVKFSDFGSGTVKNDTFQTLGGQTIAGTPFYMAPELVEKLKSKDNEIKYFHTIDIWCLCLTFYAVATLKNPSGFNF